MATGLTIEKVPANTWAVFPCTGKMPETFQDLYRKIYTEFFPTSKYQPAGGMSLRSIRVMKFMTIISILKYGFP